MKEIIIDTGVFLRMIEFNWCYEQEGEDALRIKVEELKKRWTI